MSNAAIDDAREQDVRTPGTISTRALGVRPSYKGRTVDT